MLNPRLLTCFSLELLVVTQLRSWALDLAACRGSFQFAGDTPQFRLFDAAQLGAAEWGYTGDANTLTYQSWSDSQIQVSGFSGQAGDAIEISVWNPTIGNGATWGGNLPDGSGTPRITAVTFSGSGSSLQVTIAGSGFGSAPASMPFAGDVNQFLFGDQRTHSGSGGFEAGGSRWGHGSPDSVTVNFQSWSDNQIVINGFAGTYGQGNAALQNGDPVYIVVWNSGDSSQTDPQTAWGGLCVKSRFAHQDHIAWWQLGIRQRSHRHIRAKHLDDI